MEKLSLSKALDDLARACIISAAAQEAHAALQEGRLAYKVRIAEALGESRQRLDYRMVSLGIREEVEALLAGVREVAA